MQMFRCVYNGKYHFTFAAANECADTCEARFGKRAVTWVIYLDGMASAL